MLGASSGPHIRLKDDVRRLSNSPRKLQLELLWHGPEAGRTAHVAQAHSPAASASAQQQQQGGTLLSLPGAGGPLRPAQARGAGRQGPLQEPAADLPLERQVLLQDEQHPAILPGANFQQPQQAAWPALLPVRSVKPQHTEVAGRELQQQQPGEAPPPPARQGQLCSIQAPAAAVGAKRQLQQQEGAATQPPASAAAPELEGLQQQHAQLSGTQGHVTASLANTPFKPGRLSPQTVSSPSNVARSAEQRSPGSGKSSGQCNVK